MKKSSPSGSRDPLDRDCPALTVLREELRRREKAARREKERGSKDAAAGKWVDHSDYDEGREEAYACAARLLEAALEKMRRK